MKERPIPFSGRLVRAILEGRKSQTRRLVRPQPLDLRAPPHPDEPAVAAMVRDFGGDTYWKPMHCPYGAPGETLWVREAWRAPARYDHLPPREIPVGVVPIAYEADGVRHPDAQGKLRPPMFMPRWSSRITLEVTEVRVERLQDISEEDALAEGARRWDLIPDPARERTPWGVGPRWSMFEPRDTDDCLGTARFAFGNAWDKINGDRAPWSSNPWVWCLTFRRVD